MAAPAPPTAYLQLPLLLQAALVAWFFGSTESARTGALVGVMALLGILWFGRKRRSEPHRAMTKSSLVDNERALRLTMLQQLEVGGAAGGGDTAMHTDYAMLT